MQGFWNSVQLFISFALSISLMLPSTLQGLKVADRGKAEHRCCFPHRIEAHDDRQLTHYSGQCHLFEDCFWSFIMFPLRAFCALVLSSLFTLPIQAAFPQRFGSTPMVSTVYQFPDDGSWIENLAVRCNKQLLITRFDVPELWSIDPQAGTGFLEHQFAEVTAIAGITEVREDLFAIAGFNFSIETRETSPGSGFLFMADFTRSPPTFEAAAHLPNSVILNGLATWNSHQEIVLVADTALGLISKVNIRTGDVSVVSDDAVLRPPSATGLGINGLKVHDDFVYFTTTSTSKFGRIPLHRDASPAGLVEIIATTQPFLDDFILDRDGTAYATTNANNSVIKIEPDGRVSQVAGSDTSLELAGDTALAWVDGFKERALYVSTCGGQNAPVNGTIIEPGKVVKLVL